MKYIVCGTVVQQEYEDKIPQLSNAANRFLLNFTNEIKKIYPVKILSYIGIDVPSEIKRRLKSENSIDSGIIYYFKSGFKVAGVMAYWHGICQNLKDAECIIAYNPVYAYLHIPYITAMCGKKSILILADYSPKEAYRGKLRRVYSSLQARAIRKYDMVIGLSKNVKRYLSDSQKFIHMPGGIDRFVYDYFGEKKSSPESDKIIFMYAGTLERVTGIDILLEAFVEIKGDNTELWVSGKGSMVHLVEKFVHKDNRIKYLGCPSYNDYLNNLMNAGILINPRNMELIENKNNFPSKIMEYLATGKPIVSTKFSGYEQFSDNILFVDSSVKSLKNAMIKSLGLKSQTLSCIYQKNRLLAKEFLWSCQIEKMRK